MVDSCDRPIGDHHEEVRTLTRGHAEQFREAEVVTDKRRHEQVVAPERGYLRSSAVMDGFITEREWLEFGIAGEFHPFGRKSGQLVSTFAVRTHIHNTADEVHVELACGLSQESD